MMVVGGTNFIIGGITMLSLSDFKDFIEQQLCHNRNKSLFYELTNGRLALTPSEETIIFFKQKANDIANFIQSAYEDDSIQQLSEYISNQTIQLFMEVNQYLNFSQNDYRQLQSLYKDLFKRVYRIAMQEKLCNEEIQHLFRSHYKNLQTFLFDSNGHEIFKKYKESPELFTVKCAEYTPQFQMSLLKIRLSVIRQPVLDVGCGTQGSLVHFLSKRGIEAYGIDRNVQHINNLQQANWLDYTFTPNIWGTIISHMAFSNHFMHHHLRTDGDFKDYAKKYMEILKSLKRGGSFIYAPSLPFMEEIIRSSTDAYTVNTNEHSTKVTRVK